MEASLTLESVKARAIALVTLLQEKKLTLATAESCTGGLIGALLTTLPGVSSVYLGGVISYANEVKRTLLGVSASTLESVGAVSAETAEEMVKGVLSVTGASLAAAVTGIAGPDGGSAEKPVGLVYVSGSNGHTTTVTENHFTGSREEVRLQAAEKALSLLLTLASTHENA